MVYSDSYSLNVKKLNDYIDISKKTKKQISYEANTTSRTLTRALNGEKIKLITIQNLANNFGVQINDLINDDNFDENNPAVIFEKVTDIRKTLGALSKVHGNRYFFSSNKKSSYLPNIYFHYDLRLTDIVKKEIEPLLRILRTDLYKIDKTYDEDKSFDYILRHEKILDIFSRGNTHLDNLSKYADVYYATYDFHTLRTYPYYKYSNDSEGNQTREKDGRYFAPTTEKVSLIIFSEKKSEKLTLYPNIGLSIPVLEKLFLEFAEDKTRSANKKYCIKYFEAWKSNDTDEMSKLDFHMEDQRLFPKTEDLNSDIWIHGIPYLDNNYLYRGEIISNNSKQNKKEDDM